MYTLRSNRAGILKIKKTNIPVGFDVVLYDVSSPYLFSFYSHAEDANNTSTTSSFQSKARIIDNMPSQKVTIGDIKIAYKQLGESGAKPIINNRTRSYDGHVEPTSLRAADIIKLFRNYF